MCAFLSHYNVMTLDRLKKTIAAIYKPPLDWKRPPERLSYTWLRATESDLIKRRISFVLCVEEGRFL